MHYLFTLFFTFLSFGVFGIPALAATIKVESDFNNLNVGDVFTIDLTLDTEGQMLNAAEAEIFFPIELLEYVGDDDGSSVVNLWIEKPVYHDLNRISFSGITPGGFVGNDIPLLSLTFKAMKAGQGNIEINEANLLLHDGLGTEAKLSKQNLHIAISEGKSEIKVNTVDDEIPESFRPEIIQDKDLFSGAYTLIFATEDKGSGLDHFEVKEGWFSRYVKTVSPHELKYQTLDKKISVKAIDKLGNERVEILYPQNWQPWYEYTSAIVSIIVLCVLTLILGRKTFRSSQKK